MPGGEPKFILIGEVVAPQGRRGEVRVLPLTDWPERFRLLRRVFLVPPRQGQGGAGGKAEEPLLECQIEKVWFQRQFVILKWAGCEDISTAERWRGALVAIPRAEALELPPGRYYLFQIVGLTVVTEGGEVLGEVVAVQPTGANDVYVVKRPGPGRGKELLLPATREVIREIDLERRRMVVRLLPGLGD
ncbi:MAG: ribosome maturation factor RimM [Bacillota bacterium]|nr:ribosome maturation factor RimM [Bacillota bacterium]